MSRARRSSAGAMLARSLQEQEQRSHAVVDIAQRRSPTSAIHRGIDEDGKPFIRLTFPRPKQVDQVIDVSFLVNLPNLTEPFLVAVKRRLDALRSVRSREGVRYNLRSGLCAFLQAQHPLATLADLDEQVLNAYVRWQQSPAATLGDEVLGSTSCAIKIVQGRLLLLTLLDFPLWKNLASQAISNYPRNTHPSSKKHRTPIPILPRADLERILAVSLEEIAGIDHRLAEGKRMLTEGQRLLDADACIGRKDLVSSMPLTLALLHTRWPKGLPSYKEIEEADSVLASAVRYGAACGLALQ